MADAKSRTHKKLNRTVRFFELLPLLGVKRLPSDDEIMRMLPATANRGVIESDALDLKHLVIPRGDVVEVRDVRPGSPLWAAKSDGSLRNVELDEGESPASDATFLRFVAKSVVAGVQAEPSGSSPSVSAAIAAVSRLLTERNGIAGFSGVPLISSLRLSRIGDRHERIALRVRSANVNALAESIGGEFGAGLTQMAKPLADQDATIEIRFVDKKNILMLNERIIDPIVRSLSDEDSFHLLEGLVLDGGTRSAIHVLEDQIAEGVSISIPRSMKTVGAAEAVVVIRDAYDRVKDEIAD